MKRTFRNHAFIAGIFALFTLISCEDETVAPKLCIEHPCGTVDPEATNVSLFIPNNLNISDIQVMVNDQDTTLELNGRDLANNKLFTCWQTVPTITSSSNVVLGYELDGEVVIGILNVTGLTSNQLVIEIDGDAAIISDYEECIDII